MYQGCFSGSGHAGPPSTGQRSGVWRQPAAPHRQLLASCITMAQRQRPAGRRPLAGINRACVCAHLHARRQAGENCREARGGLWERKGETRRRPGWCRAVATGPCAFKRRRTQARALISFFRGRMLSSASSCSYLGRSVRCRAGMREGRREREGRGSHQQTAGAVAAGHGG